MSAEPLATFDFARFCQAVQQTVLRAWDKG
jgi:hypothetical protein